VGRRQQPLPSGCCQGEYRSGRDRGDNGTARHRAEATCRIERSVRRALRTAEEHRSERPRKPPSEKAHATKKPSARPDKAAERKAAIAYERERKRCEREETKEKAARQKEKERRERAVEKAQLALNEAEREHARRAASLRSELEVIEDRIRSEDNDWGEEEKQLKAALKRARDGRS
jgi:hypothetical protein